MKTHYVAYRKPTRTAWVSACGRWRPERAVFLKQGVGVTCARCLRALAKRKVLVSTVTLTIVSPSGKEPEIMTGISGNALAVVPLYKGMTATVAVAHEKRDRWP